MDITVTDKIKATYTNMYISPHQLHNLPPHTHTSSVLYQNIFAQRLLKSCNRKYPVITGLVHTFYVGAIYIYDLITNYYAHPHRPIHSHLPLHTQVICYNTLPENAARMKILLQNKAKWSVKTPCMYILNSDSDTHSCLSSLNLSWTISFLFTVTSYLNVSDEVDMLSL